MDNPNIVEISEFDIEDINDNKWWALLSYFLFFIPLIFSPRTKYIKYHLNQGISFWIEGVKIAALCSVIIVLPFVLTKSNTVALISLFISGILLLPYAIVGWFGTFNAFIGQCKPLPRIGHKIYYKWK